MEELVRDKELLIARVQQVEHERDELRKDIEQLCMQQAGPSYIAVATRMHFQRTAGLEQEIENLRSKLAVCSREKSNLQEELSQAYHIKGQLADLHAAEVSKNLEAEKQLKFFQSCVASAFAERDHSIMQAEKAKEKMESMAEKLDPLERMVGELTRDAIEEKRLRDSLQSDLEKQSNQNEIFKKVVNRFYEIRQYTLCGSCEDIEWEDKCECLLRDSLEKWDFIDQGETPSSKYVSALEAEVQALRKSLDSFQSKLCVGLEIETHLKKRVHDLEKKRVWKASLAELMASAILIFLNSTISISNIETNIGGAPILIMSILIGTTIAFLVLAILPISGGHLSPVISLSAGLMGLISLSRALIYIFAQCIGGVLGVLALKVVLTSDIESKYSLGGCTIGELGLTQAFYIELICVFVYLFALRWIAFDIEKAKKFGGIVVSAAIGIIVGINIFISSTVTGVKGYSGAGMNPARCLGPAIVRGGELWNGHWIFWVAPAMASVVFFTCTRIISDDHLQPNENIHELGNILKALALLLRS